MKWPWTTEVDVTEAEQAVIDARRKLAEAERQLAQAQALGERVHRVTGEMREIRRRNHLGESVEAMFRGRA